MIKKLFLIMFMTSSLFCGDCKEKGKKAAHERDASAAYVVAAASALSSPVGALNALQESPESSLSLTIIGPKSWCCCKKGKVEKLEIQIKKPFYLYQIKHCLPQNYKDNFHKYIFKDKEDDDHTLLPDKSYDKTEIFMIYVGEVNVSQNEERLGDPASGDVNAGFHKPLGGHSASDDGVDYETL